MMMTRSNAMIIASPIVIGIAVIIDGLQALRMGLTKTCPAPELKGGGIQPRSARLPVPSWCLLPVTRRNPSLSSGSAPEYLLDRRLFGRLARA